MSLTLAGSYVARPIVCHQLPINMDFVSISSPSVIARPDGYSIPSFISLSVTASSGSIKEEGFSDAKPETAVVKATSEALERLVFKKYFSQTRIADTTNGWASHPNFESAIQNAIYELIERDVILTTWEDNGPFYEIPKNIWPKELLTWEQSKNANLEYGNLKLLLSQTSNGCGISALLMNENGNCVTGHASGVDLKSSILSAAAECFRAAHTALRFEYFDEVQKLHNDRTTVSPGAHSLAYAYDKPIPANVVFMPTSSDEILEKWRIHEKLVLNLDYSNFEILSFKINTINVVRVRSPKYKTMYWGNNIINKPKNRNPHFVG